VREAILAALRAGCLESNLAVHEAGARLSDVWDSALSSAFDAAWPPGKFESWARKSFPRVAACLHMARLEMTSPKRCDAIHLSAVAIFEMQWQELHAQEG